LTETIEGGLSMKRILVLLFFSIFLSTLALATGQEEAAAAAPKELAVAGWGIMTDPSASETWWPLHKFKEDFPAINLKFVEAPTEEYPEKVAIMLAGGTDLDVFFDKDQSMFAREYEKENLLQLDDLMKKNKFDVSVYGAAIEQLKFEGKIYALPYRNDTWVLIYNKDLFDRAGVPYPTNDMTWTQYRQTAKRLTSGSGNDKIWGTYIHTWSSLYRLPAQADLEEGNIVTADYRQLKRAFQLITDIQLVDKSAQDYATNKALGSHYTGMFWSGKVAMFYMGTWNLGQNVNAMREGKLDFNWGIAQVPQWQGKRDGCLGLVTGASINSKSKNPQLAFEFLSYICGEPGAVSLAEHGTVPALMNDNVAKAFSNIPELPDNVGEGLKVDRVIPEWPIDKLAGPLSPVFEEVVSLMATGNISVDQAIVELEKRRTEIIEQMKEF
jgi:multiple sugar transport system substrate-binding protein